MQWASTRSKSQQQRAGRILVVGIVLDDLGFCSRVTDFLLADVAFNHAAKRVPAELKTTLRQLLLDIPKRFHSASSAGARILWHPYRAPVLYPRVFLRRCHRLTCPAPSAREGQKIYFRGWARRWILGGVVKGFRGRNGVADYLESLCPVGAVNFVVCPGIAPRNWPELPCLTCHISTTILPTGGGQLTGEVRHGVFVSRCGGRCVEDLGQTIDLPGGFHSAGRK